MSVLTVITFKGCILFANECVGNITKTAYLLGSTTVNRFESKNLALIHSIPSRLIWAKNRLDGASCSAQTAHKAVQTSSAKKATGTKSLLSKSVYCGLHAIISWYTTVVDN
jgi:hypothetical protein